MHIDTIQGCNPLGPTHHVLFGRMHNRRLVFDDRPNVGKAVQWQRQLVVSHHDWTTLDPSSLQH
jgi:hypothetical protein